MKSIVIYYSRSGENYVNGHIQNLAKGNTEYIAEFLKEDFGADLFKAETAKEYAKSYMDCIREAQKELDGGERPALKAELPDLRDYDTVFIAGPCWWGTYPQAVFTQLEKLDWHGKKVMALMTHEGSGLGGCERDLKRICEGASFGKGFAVHGADASRSESTVASWAKAQV